MSNKLLEHPIISSVIAGIILWLLALVGGYLPAFWQWLKDIGNMFLSFLTQDISLPLWVLASIISALVIWRYIPIKLITTKELPKVKPISPFQHQNEVEIVIEEDDEPVVLSEQEARVMRYLIEADGRAIKPDQMSRRLNISNLEIEQITEALVDKDFIETYRNVIHGTSFGLTRHGRDFILGNQYDNT